MARREGFLLQHVLRDHVLFGGLAALLCLKVWSPAYCAAFWLSNVLIDLDHYLDLVFWSGFRAFRFHQVFHYSAHICENEGNLPVLAVEALHTAEAVIALAFLGYGLGLAWCRPVLWGMALHCAVDVCHLARLRHLHVRCHSFLEFWLRKRRMERAGLSPTRLQREAAQAALRCCDAWRWPL